MSLYSTLEQSKEERAQEPNNGDLEESASNNLLIRSLEP